MGRVPVRFFDASAKVGETVRLLAVLTYSLQERIVKAFLSQWSRIKSEDFPDGELRNQFEQLDERLTKGPMTQEVINSGGGLVHASVLKLNVDEARHLAEAIVSFLFEVKHLSYRYRFDESFRTELAEEDLKIIAENNFIN